MKTKPLTKTVLNLGLAGLISGLLAGCATPNYDKGATTSKALNASADATARTSSHIYDVLGALNNLTFKSEGDLRKQYDAFVSAAKSLDSSIASLDSKVNALQGAAAEYFNNWTNQLATIQNEDLRQLSSERRSKIEARLNDVTASYVGVKESLTAFTADVKDIQTYLGTDLTVDGLNSIKDKVAKTKVDALPLRDAIKKLQGSFAGLSAELSPMMPAGQK